MVQDLSGGKPVNSPEEAVYPDDGFPALDAHIQRSFERVVASEAGTVVGGGYHVCEDERLCGLSTFGD
jgi:hypothetical protein